MRCNFKSDARFRALAAAHALQRVRRGKMGDVQAGVGNLHREMHVALDDGSLGSRSHTAQSETEGTRARMHGAIFGHAGVFGVLHDREIQLSAEKESLTHDVVFEDGLAVVGDGDRSGGVQRTEVGERGSLARSRGGGNGKDVDDGTAFRLAKPFDPLHRIDDWNSVGHGADRCKATGRRSGSAGCDGLLVPLPGLAQVHVQIDEARRDDEPAGIEFLGLVVDAALDLVGSRDFGNAAILQQNVHGRVDTSRRIDEVPTLDQQTGARLIFSRAGSRHRIFPIARARIAMRVGTPLRTSSRMRACAPSATSLVSSRPRMIGPGCITMASFFAIFSRAEVIW